MKITEEQANAIFREEGWMPSDEDNATFKILEECDWDDNGKYSNRRSIFEFEGKCYAMHISRCGSYHTDYDYDFDLDCHEVQQVQVVIKEWVDKT